MDVSNDLMVCLNWLDFFKGYNNILVDSLLNLASNEKIAG